MARQKKYSSERPQISARISKAAFKQIKLASVEAEIDQQEAVLRGLRLWVASVKGDRHLKKMLADVLEHWPLPEDQPDEEAATVSRRRLAG